MLVKYLKVSKYHDHDCSCSYILFSFSQKKKTNFRHKNGLNGRKATAIILIVSSYFYNTITWMININVVIWMQTTSWKNNHSIKFDCNIWGYKNHRVYMINFSYSSYKSGVADCEIDCNSIWKRVQLKFLIEWNNIANQL